MRYVSTIERQGIEQGIEQDIEQGKQELGRSLILRLLTRQVGELSESTVEQVNQLPVDALEFLGEALLDFDQMVDLNQWLTEYQQQAQTEDSKLQED
ncbi:MAG: DUF4351 domain-containing protein [Cyanobacteria bacterium P01_F01_bin.150]